MKATFKYSCILAIKDNVSYIKLAALQCATFIFIETSRQSGAGPGRQSLRQAGLSLHVSSDSSKMTPLYDPSWDRVPRGPDGIQLAK